MNQDLDKKNFEKFKQIAQESYQNGDTRRAKTALMEIKLIYEDMSKKRYVATIIDAIEKGEDADFVKEAIDNLTFG